MKKILAMFGILILSCSTGVRAEGEASVPSAAKDVRTIAEGYQGNGPQAAVSHLTAMDELMKHNSSSVPSTSMDNTSVNASSESSGGTPEILSSVIPKPEERPYSTPKDKPSEQEKPADTTKPAEPEKPKTAETGTPPKPNDYDPIRKLFEKAQETVKSVT